jgi:RNA polymerase subunit RPABC4/transcription elongation factor Spt4
MQGSTCTNCGKPLREGAQFCPRCGSAVVAASPPVVSTGAPTQSQSHTSASVIPVISPPETSTCANCGNQLRAAARFCPGCGSLVAAAEPPRQSRTTSSAAPEMSPPTRASVATPMRPPVPPDPGSQSQASQTPDSSNRAAPIPTMIPPTPAPQAARTPAQPSPADRAKPREPRSVDRLRPPLNDRRVLAAAGGLVALVVAAVLVFALGGNNSKHVATGSKHATKSAAAAPIATSTTQTPAAGAATTTTSSATNVAAQTTQQLATVDSILKLAENGRQALANGDINAAIANRRSVLAEIGALHPNSELVPSVRALQAAEAYSLHADTTCGLSCSASIDQQATRLKNAFLAIFNPIAARYNTPTYAAGEI